ncbi:hypothetical protein MRX96_018122 [Rhipicephalus microplus]
MPWTTTETLDGNQGDDGICSPMMNTEKMEPTNSSASDAEAGVSNVSSYVDAADLGMADVDDKRHVTVSRSFGVCALCSK